MINGENQIISGKNKFTKLSAAQMKVLGSTNIKEINGVDIIKLNNTIIDKKVLYDSVIPGHKEFTQDIKITNLKIPSKIHGVAPENLVEIHKKYNIRPNARFRKLKILENCNVDFIKFVNITDLLSKTMKCNTNTPQYIDAEIVFKNVVLSGNITTNQINNIDIRNVVVDHGTQYIHNSKIFDSKLDIIGDFNVKLLNRYGLSSIYNNSVLSGSNADFKNNIVFDKPIGIYANIECNKINGMHIEKLKSILEDRLTFGVNATMAAVDELRKIVDYYSKYVTNNGYD